MKRVISALSIAVLWFGVCALQASKQSETAAISGTITDPTNTLIPGVSVTLTNMDTKSAVTTITDIAGKFTISKLQPGKYDVVASLQGFDTAHIQKSIASGESSQLSLKMTINAAVGDRIIVVPVPGPMIYR